MSLDGKVIKGEIEEQTHRVFQNLNPILREASLDLSDVIKVNIFITDMVDFSRLNNVYSEYFVEHKPLRSTVQAARLPLDVKLELKVVARIKQR